MMDKPIKPIELSPQKIAPDKGAEFLATNEALILQNVDLIIQEGMIRRANGYIPSQINSSSATVTNAFVYVTRDCKRGVMDYGNAGAVRATPGNSLLPCSGPLPLWTDWDAFGTDDPSYNNPNRDNALAFATALPAYIVVNPVGAVCDFSPYFVTGYVGSRPDVIYWNIDGAGVGSYLAAGYVTTNGTLVTTELVPSAGNWFDPATNISHRNAQSTLGFSATPLHAHS